MDGVAPKTGANGAGRLLECVGCMFLFVFFPTWLSSPGCWPLGALVFPRHDIAHKQT